MNNSIVLGLGMAELLLILCGIAYSIFALWMAVDAVLKEESTGAKIGWLLIIIFFPCLGAPVYLFVRKLPRGNRPK